MTDREHTPAPDAQGRNPRLADPRLVRNLAIVLVIVVLGFGFGRPLAAGYYFGGCDNAEDTQQYVIHVLGIEMCRDVSLTSNAERKTLHEAEATSLAELTEGETSAPEGAPAAEKAQPAPNADGPPGT
jgi:hypothetical protein